MKAKVARWGNSLALDYRQRRVQRVTSLPPDCCGEMLARARTLLT